MKPFALVTLAIVHPSNYAQRLRTCAVGSTLPDTGILMLVYGSWSSLLMQSLVKRFESAFTLTACML